MSPKGLPDHSHTSLCDLTLSHRRSARRTEVGRSFTLHSRCHSLTIFRWAHVRVTFHPSECSVDRSRGGTDGLSSLSFRLASNESELSPGQIQGFLRVRRLLDFPGVRTRIVLDFTTLYIKFS